MSSGIDEAIEGRYAIVVSAMGREKAGMLSLGRPRGGRVDGVVEMLGRRVEAPGLSVDHDTVTGAVTADTPMGRMRLRIRAKVFDGHISGRISALVGKASFEGDRVDG